MAYDLNLADRIRRALEKKNISYIEKEMFGGIAFMVKEKMCIGIMKNDMLARIDPAVFDDAKKKKGVGPMKFGGRTMKGFLCVTPAAIDTASALGYWIDLCLEFNPEAKSSKKKK
ncbi:MAG: TfoX/Sxy family protein [Bacteroidota bacterium]